MILALLVGQNRIAGDGGAVNRNRPRKLYCAAALGRRGYRVAQVARQIVVKGPPYNLVGWPVKPTTPADIGHQPASRGSLHDTVAGGTARRHHRDRDLARLFSDIAGATAVLTSLVSQIQ